MWLFTVTIGICVTGNSSALAVDAAAELCALGNLVPMVPLRELDKKQWKTSACLYVAANEEFSVSVNSSIRNIGITI